jgi:hypothetical protein
MPRSLTEEARLLAKTIRDRARETIAATRAQVERSEEMRDRNQALKERVAERTASRDARR